MRHPQLWNILEGTTPMRARTVVAVAVVLAPLALCGCSGSRADRLSAGDVARMVNISPAGRPGTASDAVPAAAPGANASASKAAAGSDAAAKGAAAQGAAAKDGGASAAAAPVASVPGSVDPNQPVVVRALHGTLTDVTVAGPDGTQLAGAISADDRSWSSTGPLSAGRSYTVRVGVDDGQGGRGSTVATFTTRAAPETLTAKLTPGDGAVYGVGEPITATLSNPIHDPAERRVVEGGLSVSSSPGVQGAWYWVDDSTLHFRPESYWPAHARIGAAFDLDGRLIGGKLYGGPASRISFSTGDKLLALTDAAAHYLTVYRNGNAINTIPVTTGKPGFSTRSGIKVVLEQSPVVFMNSSTVGIPDGTDDSYHKDVAWDTRVTWSGEYVHAAPWSVGAQGVANISHGCVGMSTGNAHWFYDTFRRGDLVQVVNSYGHMMEPFGNGFGDWNVDWDRWKSHSALQRVVDTGAGAVADQEQSRPGYLRPAA